MLVVDNYVQNCAVSTQPIDVHGESDFQPSFVMLKMEHWAKTNELYSQK